MTDEELKQLVESNARTAQAILDSMVEARHEREELREEFQEGMNKLQNAIIRLVDIQEGMSHLLASLDDDRPTLLRRLMSIENKVDRLLNKEENNNL
jgi:uncharacterized coiled-coil DUF342 family protein